MEKTILLQLRDAAKVERDTLRKFNMTTVADELHVALRALAEDATQSNLVKVNGLWARAVRTLGFAGTQPTPGGHGAGMKDGALLQAVA